MKYNMFDKNDNFIASFEKEEEAIKYQELINKESILQKVEEEERQLSDICGTITGTLISDKKGPYLLYRTEDIMRVYNPNYGDDKICKCGHTYARHFDFYEGDVASCCKYCGCSEFKLAEDQREREYADNV